MKDKLLVLISLAVFSLFIACSPSVEEAPSGSSGESSTSVVQTSDITPTQIADLEKPALEQGTKSLRGQVIHSYQDSSQNNIQLSIKLQGSNETEVIIVEFSAETLIDFSWATLAKKDFIEVFFLQAEDENSLSALVISRLADAASCIFTGEIIDISLNDGIGAILLESEDESILFYVTRESLFSTPAEGLIIGNTISIYHSYGIIDSDSYKTANALEIFLPA